MKKVILTLMALFFVTGCTRGEYVEELPTSFYEEASFVRESVRLMNVDGELYFDSGLVSDLVPRCGTLDGNLENMAEELEVPKNSGECNFEAKGYQSATTISKEVPIDGEWVVFKKINSYGDDLTRYKYAYKLKGTHPNAVKESEYIIFAHSTDVTFDMITKYFFSSLLEDHMLDIRVVFPDINDKWGILMYAEDVTSTSLTIKIEQFGGYHMGTLQTGSWYEIERQTDNGWEKLPYLPSEYERAWTSEARFIKERDITSFEVNWENLYGSLEKGTYRIGKKITDFIKPGEFTDDIYYTMFTV